MLPTAREVDVVIELENMTPSESGGSHFLSALAHSSRFMHEFEDPQSGVVYDTGHASMSAEPQTLDILEAMGEQVAVWHLADYTGDRDSHMAPGRGVVDWDSTVPFTARIGFSGSVTMESAPWGSGSDYALETWQNSVCELDELVHRELVV